MYEVLKVQTLIILDSSMVEHSAVNRVVVGSSPIGSIDADVAQLAEQLICNQQVIGSSPIIGLYIWTISSVG